MQNYSMLMTQDLKKKTSYSIANVGELTNVGQQMTQDKNIQLAVESNRGQGEQFQLLITKEVFRVEKVPITDDKPLISPFLWTDYLDSNCQQWPFSNQTVINDQDQNIMNSQNKITIKKVDNEENTNKIQEIDPLDDEEFQNKEISLEKDSSQSIQKTNISQAIADNNKTPEMSDEIENKQKKVDIKHKQNIQQSELEQIDSKQIVNKETDNQEDQQLLEYLKALELEDRKEYNLRKPTKLDKIYNEGELLKKTGLIRNYNSSNRRQAADNVEEGFFDDWPPEIIRKYKLKVSNKIKQEIYSNQLSSKRQRTSSQKETDVNECRAQKLITKESQEMNRKDETITQNESESKKMTDNSGTRSNKFNLKRFLITSQLHAHHKHVLSLAISQPHKLIGLYVFILRKKSNLWRRGYLIEYITPPKQDSQKRYFLVELQDKDKTKKQYNLARDMFIIDCTYKTQELEEREEQEHQTSNNHKNFPLYNNKKRVRKLLQKREEEKNSQVHSVNKFCEPNLIPNSFKSEDKSIELPQNQITDKQIDQPEEDLENPKDEKSVEVVANEIKEEQIEQSIQISYDKQSVKEIKLTDIPVVQPLVISDALNIDKPIGGDAPIGCQPLEQSIKISELKEANVESTLNDKTMSVRIPVKSNQQSSIEQDINNPRNSWIKDMKIQLLTKSRDNLKKVLKFYYINIQDQDLTSSDEEQQTSIKEPILNAEPNEIMQINEMFSQIQNMSNSKTQNNQNLQNIRQTLQKPEVTQNPFVPYNEQFLTQQQLEFMIEQQNFVSNQNAMQVTPPAMMLQQQMEPYTTGPVVDQKLLLQSLEHENYLVEQQKLKLYNELRRFDGIQQENGLRDRNRISKSEEYILNKLQMDITQKQELAKEQIEQLCIMQHLLEQIYRQHTQMAHSDMPQPSNQGPFKVVNKADQLRQNNSKIENEENNSVKIQSKYKQIKDTKDINYEDDCQIQNTYDQNDQLSQNTNQEVKQNHKQVEDFKNFQEYLSYQQFEKQKSDDENPEAKVESIENIIDEDVEETTHWRQQYHYLQLVQQVLDKIDTLGEDKKTQKSYNEAVKTIENGIDRLEQGYHQEKMILEEIIKQMNIHEELSESEADQDNANHLNCIHSSKNIDNRMDNIQQQIQINTNQVVPDYFINHINYLSDLNEIEKDKPSKIDNSAFINDKPNASCLQISQIILNQQRLEDILNQFYHRMIVLRGFKKCKCPACIKMIYPMLIRYDLDNLKFLEDHHAKQKLFDQNENERDKSIQHSLVSLLQVIFSLKKPDNIIKQELDIQNNKLKDSKGIYDAETTEYIKQYPCFNAVIQKVQEEQTEEVQSERYNTQLKLPKFMQFMKTDPKQIQESKVVAVRTECEEQIVKFLNSDRSQTVKEDIDPLYASRILQLELDLLKTMQKLVTQLKLLNTMPRHITAGCADKFQYFIKKLTQLHNQKKKHITDKSQIKYQNNQDQNYQSANQKQDIYSQQVEGIEDNACNFNNNYVTIGSQLYTIPYSFDQMYSNQSVPVKIPQNFHTNYNNCQIYQPQIINQNYVPNQLQNQASIMSNLINMQKGPFQQFQHIRQPQMIFTGDSNQQQMTEIYNQQPQPPINIIRTSGIGAEKKSDDEKRIEDSQNHKDIKNSRIKKTCISEDQFKGNDDQQKY